MLQQFALKNFKLFGETGVTIVPGRITVLSVQWYWQE